MNNNSEDRPRQPERENSRPDSARGVYDRVSVLGRGGMGTVYLAEQTEPVHRRVALKVMNPVGSQKERIFARFRAERQALALMNHPHIATVYDAGVTDDGWPYLAMELVDGEPISRYCDRRNLGIRERLGLFLQICAAIEHAHQKMVIHRDLKPSNILVAEQEGHAIAKVIDFGIAKGTERDLTGHEGLTQAGLPVGTPMFMSPEQIDGRGQDIDARADIYALGVILYVLLSGGQPFDTGDGEVFRLMTRVIEEEPPLPSARFEAMGEKREAIALQRGTDISSLKRQLRGDLNGIVMKAMAKNREQRYGSVADLRADIHRYLESRPVSARSTNWFYQSQKFFRRHVFGMVVGLLIFLGLVVGIAMTSIAMMREKRAKLAAKESETTTRSTLTYLRKILATVDPNAPDRNLTVIDLLGQASEMISKDLAGQPEVEGAIRQTIGWTFLELGLYEEAEAELERAVDVQGRVLGKNHPDTLEAVNAMGRLWYKKGRYEEAEAVHREVLALQEASLGEEDPVTLWTTYNLAKALDRQGKWNEAERLYRRVLSTRTRLLGAEHPHTLVSVNSLCLLLSHVGKLAEAERLQRANMNKLRRILGPENPNTLNSMANLVEVLNMAGKYGRAKSLGEKALEGEKKVLGPGHPETLATMTQLCHAYTRTGELDRAEAMLPWVLERQLEILGERHPQTIESMVAMANLHVSRERYQEALPMLSRGFELANRELPRNNWKTKVEIGGACGRGSHAG